MGERAKDAIYDRIVFGDIYTDVRVEELYQAFKARLMEELVAQAPEALVKVAPDFKLTYKRPELALIERESTPAASPTAAD